MDAMRRLGKCRIESPWRGRRDVRVGLVGSNNGYRRLLCLYSITHQHKHIILDPSVGVLCYYVVMLAKSRARSFVHLTMALTKVLPIFWLCCQPHKGSHNALWCPLFTHTFFAPESGLLNSACASAMKDGFFYSSSAKDFCNFISSSCSQQRYSQR